MAEDIISKILTDAKQHYMGRWNIVSAQYYSVWTLSNERRGEIWRIASNNWWHRFWETVAQEIIF